ncbi:MAG TPA: PAS domain S-box protein, partial [Methanomassiliicoccales archaeon]|nr:PAS domain S-box protein [Methanomassiliicoccales archaeon]
MTIDEAREKGFDHAGETSSRKSVWKVDKSGNTRSVSPGVAEALGINQYSISGRKILDFVDGESGEVLKDLIRARYSPERYAFSVKRADGSKFYANVAPAPEAKDEGPIGALLLRAGGGEVLLAWVDTETGAATVLPARRTQEAAVRLQYEKELLEVIMENTFAHIAYLDRDFKFLRVNSA